MEILKGATPALLAKAKLMLEKKAVVIKVKRRKDFYIEVNLRYGDGYKSKAVVCGGHTSLNYLEDNGKIIIEGE